MKKKEYGSGIIEKVNKLFEIRKKIMEALIRETQAKADGNLKEEQKYCMIKEDLQADAGGLAYELDKSGVQNVWHRIDKPGIKLEHYSIPLRMDGLDVNAFTLAAAAIESLIETDIKMLEASTDSPTKRKALEKVNIVKKWYAASRDRIMHTMNNMNESAQAQQKTDEEKRDRNGGGCKT